jgi:hypothetical protein
MGIGSIKHSIQASSKYFHIPIISKAAGCVSEDNRLILSFSKSFFISLSETALPISLLFFHIAGRSSSRQLSARNYGGRRSPFSADRIRRGGSRSDAKAR